MKIFTQQIKSWRLLRLLAVSSLAIPGWTSAQELAPVETPPVDPVADPDGLRAEARAHELGSLKNVPVPIPSQLALYVKDRAAAIRLGKALFWDEQAGSDGMACASCHFHAGADPRTKNQVSPSFIGGNGTFDFFASKPGSGGPNYTMTREDFPFHRKKDATSSKLGENVASDTDDVCSSAGALNQRFPGQAGLSSLAPRTTQDIHFIRQLGGAAQLGYSPSVSLTPPTQLLNRPTPSTLLNAMARRESNTVISPDPLGFFIASGRVNLVTRRVEPRNAPTVINAVFNHRNNWDGRANAYFNGRSPYGPRDKDAKVFSFSGGNLRSESILLDNASLASQAVGPVGSVLEMSAHGRQFHHIARKLLNSVPLGVQTVSTTDSVLGKLANPTGKGLKTTYAALISESFENQWWNAPGTPVQIEGTGYSQMEANFSLFWGLSILLYQSTLVSDQTPFDRFMEGSNSALTATERQGLSLFMHQGKCAACHHGPEFTQAAVSQLQHSSSPSQLELIERMVMGDQQTALYDNGFYNINVRPVQEDIGLGGTDPFRNPLSFSAQVTGSTIVDKESGLMDSSKFEVDPGTPPQPGERTAVMGAFKTPGLRNIDLTGPYFHNGGTLTLEQVVQFYARGSDFIDLNKRDGFPFDRDIERLKELNGNQANIRALAAFMRALTDPRVAYERAPFDHPSLSLPHGHDGGPMSVTPDRANRGAAKTTIQQIPAVGANGSATPLKPFLGGSMLDSKGVPTADGL
jgi:cytochrome c peroxidase